MLGVPIANTIVMEDQTGLSKDKLKKGDKVSLLIVNANMCLVEKDGRKYWINEKFLNKSN